MSTHLVEAARRRRLDARPPPEDRCLTTTHAYASGLLVTSRDLKRQADEAAWNLDLDVADELQRRSDHFKAEAHELLEDPNDVYPLF